MWFLYNSGILLDLFCVLLLSPSININFQTEPWAGRFIQFAYHSTNLKTSDFNLWNSYQFLKTILEFIKVHIKQLLLLRYHFFVLQHCYNTSTILLQNTNQLHLSSLGSTKTENILKNTLKNRVLRKHIFLKLSKQNK